VAGNDAAANTDIQWCLAQNRRGLCNAWFTTWRTS